MGEFIDTLFTAANAIPTGLFLFVLLYWLIVIFGFLGTDFLDFDIDADVDIDGGDVEFEASSGDISWINHVLIFFNLGKVPFMIWLTIVTFPLWFITVNVNTYLGISNFFLGLLTLLPVLIASLFVGKIITWPFMGFFERLDRDNKPKEVIGKVGLVTMSANADKRGQAEINYDGTFLRLYINTRKDVAVSKGEKVLFVEKLNSGETFLVEPYNEII